MALMSRSGDSKSRDFYSVLEVSKCSFRPEIERKRSSKESSQQGDAASTPVAGADGVAGAARLEGVDGRLQVLQLQVHLERLQPRRRLPVQAHLFGGEA